MFKFGIELECFFLKHEITGIAPSILQRVLTPPPYERDFPLDAFAGLVELRSNPHSDIFKCWGEIFGEKARLESEHECSLDSSQCQHQFNSTELVHIRKNPYAPVKDRQVDVMNLYGRKPKILRGGSAIASFQLNISNEIMPQWEKEIKLYKVPIPAQYGLLDIPRIVESLDDLFAYEIKKAKRQPGCYSIKDGVRLEYRSLPNFSFTVENIGKIKNLFESF